MNFDEELRETFRSNERRAPDAADVLEAIRADIGRGSVRRGIRLAPVAAAGVVVAIAAAIAVTHSTAKHPTASGTEHAPATRTPTDTVISPPAPSVPSLPDTQASATSIAQTILHSIAIPDGATEVHNVNASLDESTLQLSSVQAEASGVWRIPGTLSAVVDFAREHPAPGFSANCTCGGATAKWIDFSSQDQQRAIDYVLKETPTGVMIGITAIVPWVPDRPSWSLIPANATSVDVTVERTRQAGTEGGAPTVQRTLGVAATQRLAVAANALRPQAESLCLGPVIMVARTDILVFHTPGRTITFTMPAMNCPQFTIQTTGQTPTYVEVGAFDTDILAELGLPANYGQ